MKKSYLAQFFLTFFFGPLGLFYSSTAAALGFTVMALVLAFGTFGLGLIFLLLLWPVVMLVGFATVNAHNSKIQLEQTRHQQLLDAVRSTNQEPREEVIPELLQGNKLSREHQFYIWFIVALSAIAVLSMLFKS